MQILATIGSGVFGGAGVEFPTFPLTSAVALNTLWHYRFLVVPECDPVHLTNTEQCQVAADPQTKPAVTFAI